MEDDTSLREGMVELISEQADVREAGSVAEALARLAAEPFTLVVTDLRIGQTGEGGRLILEAARKRLLPVGIVSAASAEDVVRVLRPHEPDTVLRKPFQLEEMISLVERFVRLHQDVARRAAAGVPPAATWTPVDEGLSTWEGPDGQWWRLASGTHPSRPLVRGRAGLMLVEGVLEVDGERREPGQYFFLASGPRAMHTPEGCVAVSLALSA